MRYKIIMLLLLVIGFNSGYSQSKIWQQIKIRKAFETNSEDDDKAAILSFTFPKNKTNYFLINAGIGYEFGKSSKETKNKKIFKNSFSGFFVYNRNNQVDKEQNNYKLGVTSNQIFYTNTESSTAIFGANSIEYMRDYKDSTHSFLMTTYWYPFSKKSNSIKLGGYAQSQSLIAYKFLPQLGLEYQNAFDTKSISDKGFDLRSFFSIGGSLLFKKRTYEEGKLLEKNRWTKGVELNVTYDGRYSIAKNISKGNDFTSLFKSEIVFYPTQDNKISIGLSYNSGESPIDGIEKQTFWLLAFKVKK